MAQVRRVHSRVISVLVETMSGATGKQIADLVRRRAQIMETRPRLEPEAKAEAEPVRVKKRRREELTMAERDESCSELLKAVSVIVYPDGSRSR